MFQTAFICIRQFYGHRFITKTRASSIQNGVIWKWCKMQYEKTDMHRNVALPVKQHLLCYVYNKEINPALYPEAMGFVNEHLHD